LEDLALRSSDVVITICPDLSSYVHHIIKNPLKHIMIENSIYDPVKIYAESCNTGNPISRFGKEIDDTLSVLKNKKRFIVYAGTLEPYQGIDILIQAFKVVVSEQPDAFLVVVGGNKNQVAHYSTLAEKHRLNGHILFTGRVPQFLAQRYCRLASILVSPRTGGTNTPLKIYEQLASGKPIVATNIYSHTQVLNDSVAFLVEPNPGDMAGGIIEALQEDGEGSHKAANAGRLYTQKYARPVYIEKMRRVMELLS
jgi:glycosyltransferase involved in cell wall biosynthesis